MVSDAEHKRIIETADDFHNDTISFLQEMIQTPSINPPGKYSEIHELVKRTYESNGWKCETVLTPDILLEQLDLDPAYPRPNLLAYVTRGTGPTIVLNAHFDTVPAKIPEDWEYDPFSAKIDNGRVYGRGAHDSKGRIATYTLAMRVLEATDLLPPNATVILAITCDEETGGEAGPGYLVNQGVLQPDYAIVEGNCDDVWIGASGVRHFHITVHGQASHAGVNPEEGVNAILGANRVLGAIEAYAEDLSSEKSNITGIDSPTCIPATIEGGVKTNVVPAKCSFTVDHRIPPDYDSDELEDQFIDAINKVTPPEGVDIEVEVMLRADPYMANPTDFHVQVVQKNAETVFGREFDLIAIRGFSDGRFFAATGAQTVHFGPGDSTCNPHGTDENIPLGQVRDAAATVAASVIDFARYHAHNSDTARE